jgi:2-dehydropantoate 2-reductase
MTAVTESGLSISGIVEGLFLPETKTQLDGSEDADAVIITVKAKDLATALDSTRPIVQRGAKLVVIQNGLSILKAAAKEPAMIIGVTMLGATYACPGKVVFAGEGDTFFGTIKGGEGAAKDIAEAFNSVGLDSYVSEDVVRQVWVKAIGNAAANPLTAIARCKNGELLKDENLSLLLRDLCLEGVTVAQGCGLDIDPEEELELLENTLRRTAANKSSMLQDVERGRTTEIEEITGELVRFGREKGIEARMNLTMYLLVKSMDEKRTRWS